MAAPLIGLAIGAAARLAAKKVAQEATKKAVKTGATKAAMKATNKGSGKPKYQNVVKEGRLQPKKAATPIVTSGKKMTPEQIKRVTQKNPNLAKEIDREAKMKKGQITAKPKTPKVPVKKTK
jgi:hypothetical protein